MLDEVVQQRNDAREAERELRREVEQLRADLDFFAIFPKGSERGESRGKQEGPGRPATTTDDKR